MVAPRLGLFARVPLLLSLWGTVLVQRTKCRDVERLTSTTRNGRQPVQGQYPRRWVQEWLLCTHIWLNNKNLVYKCVTAVLRSNCAGAEVIYMHPLHLVPRVMLGKANRCPETPSDMTQQGSNNVNVQARHDTRRDRTRGESGRVAHGPADSYCSNWSFRLVRPFRSGGRIDHARTKQAEGTCHPS